MFSLGGALIGLQNQANLQGNMLGYAPRKGADIWSVGSTNSSSFWTPERMANWKRSQGTAAPADPNAFKTEHEVSGAEDLPQFKMAAGGGGGTASMGLGGSSSAQPVKALPGRPSMRGLQTVARGGR